jgi:hypothetical protein
MLVVRVTENVRAVQSSYYSSCPCPSIRTPKAIDLGVHEVAKKSNVCAPVFCLIGNETADRIDQRPGYPDVIYFFNVTQVLRNLVSGSAISRVPTFSPATQNSTLWFYCFIKCFCR